jgi:hypothetical protein
MKLDLTVNGEKVETNRFVQDIVTGVILAMVATLKDTEDPRTVELKIEKD